MRFIIVLLLLMLCSIADAHDWFQEHEHPPVPIDKLDELCAFPTNFELDRCKDGEPETPGSQPDNPVDEQVVDPPPTPQPGPQQPGPQQPGPQQPGPQQPGPQLAQPQRNPTTPESVATHNVSPPQPVTVVEHNIILTEIMFRDWSSTGGGGKPQWFELYNSGSRTGTLNGWTMVFETRKGEVSVPLDNVSIKPQETLIVTKRLVNRPWSRNIENVYVQKELQNLKGKWVLIDAAGNEVYRRTYRWNWGIGGHTADGYRQSVAILPTVAPPANFDNFYGAWTDVSTVSYHKPVVRAAPSLQRIQFKMWAALKSEERD